MFICDLYLYTLYLSSMPANLYTYPCALREAVFIVQVPSESYEEQALYALNVGYRFPEPAKKYIH